jgi:hypothetical protein
METQINSAAQRHGLLALQKPFDQLLQIVSVVRDFGTDGRLN